MNASLKKNHQAITTVAEALYYNAVSRKDLKDHLLYQRYPAFLSQDENYIHYETARTIEKHIKHTTLLPYPLTFQ